MLSYVEARVAWILPNRGTGSLFTRLVLLSRSFLNKFCGKIQICDPRLNILARTGGHMISICMSYNKREIFPGTAAVHHLLAKARVSLYAKYGM